LASPSQYAAEFYRQKEYHEEEDLHDGKGFDAACMGDMRACAEIDERATAVDGGASAVGDFVFDEVHFVFAVLEHFQQDCLGEIKTLEGLFLLDGRLGNLLQRLVIFSRHRSMIRLDKLCQIPLVHSHIVEESVMSRWSMT
jgi:hypothetical protein